MPASAPVTVPGRFGFAAQGDGDSVAQELRSSARRRFAKAARLQREADRALAEAVALHEAAGPGPRLIETAERLHAVDDLIDAITSGSPA